MSHEDHKKAAAKSCCFGVVTFSDTREQATDKSGQLIIQLLQHAGHKLVEYQLVRENPVEMEAACAQMLGSECEVVITNGGTGLTDRDNSIEIARKFFSKELPGFGEIFRYLSFQQIGSPAMLSRATAGRAGNKLLVCLPGSSKAVALAVKRMIVPELAHMLWEINRR